MTEAVEVRTGARLHFGLFTTGRPAGRLGGIGMMIDRPGFAIRAKLGGGGRDVLTGPPEAVSRLGGLLERLRSGRRRDDPDAWFEVSISEEVPPHRGFGSGTQLTLAARLLTALALRYEPTGHRFSGWHLPEYPMGRGERSLVGVRGVADGGFVVDPGPFAADLVDARPWPPPSCVEEEEFVPPPLDETLRRSVPEGWRFVVVDPRGTAGASGDGERAAFAELPPMPEKASGRLVSLASERIVPGLDRRDFREFASGVAEFNRIVGEHFAPVQGGVYAHPLIPELSRTLADTDWPHLAQSSWGPAAVVFCESEGSGEALRRFLSEKFSPAEARVFLAAPLNRGASVEIVGGA